MSQVKVALWWVLFAVACFALFRCADSNAEDWTLTDTALQLGVSTALYEDYRQTRSIDYETTHETNPFLGRAPSSGRVRSYFVAVAAGSAIASYLLPARYRTVLQMSEIALEVTCISRNHYVYGLNFKL